jgi:spore coat protein, CotS family
MQGMDREIAEVYGLEVRGIAPYKDNFVVNTNKGRKVLKKMIFSQERILFVHGAKEHLVNKGFVTVDRYLPTISGDPSFVFEGVNYVLIDFIDGRECNFGDDEEARKSSIVLAALHSASKGYIPTDGAKIQDELGNLPICFSKRLEDIKKLKKQAKKGKSRFDHLFLENVDYFISQGENAVAGLDRSNYIKLVEEARNERCFCHHDYTHHNIISSDDKLWIGNFDYCCFELKVYDLANLLRRKMRKCDWNIEKARLLIDGYTSVVELDNDDMEVMKLILLFPQKFWRVVNRYYNSRRSWSERSFVVKLQEVIDEVAGHDRFMSHYNLLMQ